ncbi:hypothetical protein O7623_22910 [Solwaraspora sp. WMMD791]|uniref:hypothetical protein n=1 Tax=Solwaraspora sp. WMMD791 TaxID=3016086 RepID=UPI00249C2774|nr:hypothetical protein [Solwaraspora sp. WMMD791]WFE26178.1 hypothetical protein O7623_22910 [Solwaraspora sp. WMMD791]
MPAPHQPTPLPNAGLGPPRRRADLTVLGQIEAQARTRITLTLPSNVIDPDTPPTPLPMVDFRLYVMRAPGPIRDRAWRCLAETARAHRGDWNLYSLGVAYPKLRAQANKLTAYLAPGPAAQVHYTLAIEFLFALHRLDLTTPNLFPRLTDAAYTHASGRKRQHPPPTYDLDALPDGRIPHSEHGNPEHDAHLNDANQETVHDVLNRLVTHSGGQTISDTQATLIRRTYLNGETLRHVATDLHLSEPSASKQRSRAATTIARLLGRHDLTEPTPTRPAVRHDPPERR